MNPVVHAIPALFRAITADEAASNQALEASVMSLLAEIGGADRLKVADYLSHLAKAAQVGSALRRLVQSGALTAARDGSGARLTIYRRAEGTAAQPQVV